MRTLFDALIAATHVAAHASDRSSLLADTCAAIVAGGAFAHAWIGADEDGDGRLERLAVAGDGSESTDGQRPGGVFPLHSRALPTAVLAVDAEVAGAFGTVETALLDSLARSTGVAIDALASTDAAAIARAGTGAAVAAEAREAPEPFVPDGLELVAPQVLRVWRAERRDALAQLASGVAHDFKNILWGLDLIGQSLAAAHEPPDPVAADARLIAEAVAHGTALTRQLMDFARPRVPNAAIVNVDLTLVAVEPMLRRLLGDVHRLLVRRGAQGARVHLDRRQLEDALLNLVMNARDVMREPGLVTIASDVLTLGRVEAAADGLAAGRYAVVTVADTGAGMPSAALEHVFEPYVTTKAGEKGAGLGLATTFGIVSAAGGSIAVESELGRGTTFRILLPLVGSPTADS